MQNQNNIPQKKYLTESRKQLRVWVLKEKYELFKELVDKNGDSVYGLVNRMIDEYIEKKQ